MPAYDYRCTSCDTVFEVVRRASDTTTVRCPSCEGDTKRVFTPVGVHFKGSGFHSTDYRTQPAKASATEPKPDAAPSCPAAGSGGCGGCAAAS